MKQKKILTLFLLSWLFFGVSLAQSISFSVEGDWVFGNGCLVPVDVIVDSKWENISAMDLMMESSMEYKDFVATDAFPYYLPPVIRSNGLLHIVGFTVDPKERFNWAEKVWTIYFQQKEWFSDGAVRLYFLEEWNTTDTNLSIAWWVDVLKDIGDVYVSFSDELPACAHESALISGWFAGMSYQDSLNSTMQKIYDRYWKVSFWTFIQNNVFLVIAFFLLVAIVVLFFYRKRFLAYFEKKSVWKNLG